MFRAKKESGDSPEPVVKEEAPEADLALTPAKETPKPSVQIPARPAGNAGYHPDIPRRPSEPPSLPHRSEPAVAISTDNNSLIVGPGIHLKGEITSCDKVVIEGHVEASLSDARQMEIGASGEFSGKAEVAEADISGRFDGELTVRDRLCVRSTGRVSGKIRYGRIVIESGGEIVGELAALEPQSTTSRFATAFSQPAPEPSSPVKPREPAEERTLEPSNQD